MRTAIKILATSFAALALALTTTGAASPTAPAPGTDWTSGDSRADVRQLTHADAATLQHQVDEQLRTTRGGTQISANEVSYRGGSLVVALPLPGRATAPDSSAAVRTKAADTKAAGTDAVAIPNGVYSLHGCEAGAADDRWYCFYQDANFGGRRLQWNLSHCNVQRNDFLDFTAYGFARQVSSWVNTSALMIWAFDGNWNQLWYEAPANPPSGYHDTESSYVGNAYNDMAYYAESC